MRSLFGASGTSSVAGFGTLAAKDKYEDRSSNELDFILARQKYRFNKFMQAANEVFPRAAKDQLNRVRSVYPAEDGTVLNVVGTLKNRIERLSNMRKSKEPWIKYAGHTTRIYRLGKVSDDMKVLERAMREIGQAAYVPLEETYSRIQMAAVPSSSSSSAVKASFANDMLYTPVTQLNLTSDPLVRTVNVPGMPTPTPSPSPNGEDTGEPKKAEIPWTWIILGGAGLLAISAMTGIKKR
jgi:hypothetical protein